MKLYEQFNEQEIELLRSRAQQVAQAADNETSEERKPVLVVQVENEHYALDTSLLSAVHSDIRVVPVPCVPRYVAGVINIRGKIVPALDLAELLGIVVEDHPRGHVVVVNRKHTTVALCVAKVKDVISYTSDELIPLSTDAEAGMRYVDGVLPDGTALLDVEALLDDPSILINDNTLNS